MKKFLTVVLTSAMLFSCASFARAEAFKPPTEIDREVFVGDILKAKPEKVVKDGEIGVGEYVKSDVVTDTYSEDCDVDPLFGSSEYYDTALEMCSTSEFHFSWDEEHGFNFAVRFKPPRGIIQELEAGTNEDGALTDDFARQTAVNFVSHPSLVIHDDEEKAEKTLYYTVAKSTLDGGYLEGHWNLLGPTGEYDPEHEADYIIVYGEDGYVTCEWSIPFEKMGISGEVGTDVFFSISCTSGDALGDGEEDSFNKCYGVGLGEYGFLTRQVSDKYMAYGTISNYTVEFFDDVSRGDWFHDYVRYACDSGLMQGKGEGRFAPAAQMTRAELVTVFYRMAGAPEGEYSAPFEDLTDGWYTDAVGWAYENGFTEGVSDTLFAPNDPVTREQTATFFARYLSSFDLTDFPMSDWLGYTYSDEAEISDWAIDGVRLMGTLGVVEGYLDGEDNPRFFRPRQSCTRAELAKIISVFDETVISKLK